ncbi:DUF688 domain-containing protein [Quillaja saponaria]|uniref:DUF688 domain-containing protein n=1 Tax=Quillaja saponaria TaxID=32244 RepID=A0AAD7M4L0_QUISA|nr:DUF688 domain-containing protein [Quillaja saponaria]
MESSTLSNPAKIVRKKCDQTIFSTKKYMNNSAESRRTPSFSSSSSSSSSSLESSYKYFTNDSPLSPSTPLRFSGVPFSWEHLPGIPKQLQTSIKMNQSSSLQLMLPLPAPPTNLQPSKRYNLEDQAATRKKNYSLDQTFRKDPFLAAIVKCSKDNIGDHEDTTRSNSNLWNRAKVTRNLSDRFGFISLYASCKNTCAISESIIHLPNPSSNCKTSTYSHRS